MAALEALANRVSEFRASLLFFRFEQFSGSRDAFLVLFLTVRRDIIESFMRYAARFLGSIPMLCTAAMAATFGTAVTPPGGAAYSDIVLDEARTRVYLVNTSVNRVDIYNYRTRAFTSIPTDTQPVSAALSRDGKFLYVSAYTAAALDVIDLNAGQISARISLPTNPEGVAVGADGRVLITAIGTGTATTNTLLIYDPSPDAINAISNVPVVPPAATPPALPTPSGRIYNSYRSRLLASSDGKFIIGVNGPSAAAKVVFVYESASGTVLRSRQVANLSTVLAVASDGSKFMSGGTLFDSATLQVVAQENTANAPFTFTGNNTGVTVFNAQANQGGSVFAPDNSVIYSAFNVAPLGATRPNVTELLLNDPDNLLIAMGLQMPENLAGKMVIDGAGANIYAISDSGLMILPVSTIAQSPLAVPQTRSVLLTNDVCGLFKGATASLTLDNAGRGRFTASVANASATATVVITPGLPGQPPQIVTASTNPPAATVVNTGATPVINFRYNPASATGPGTNGPSDFSISSPEAINIPGTVHVYQNNRDSISSGNIVPVSLNASASEGLTDIVSDSARQRLYITNSGLNRIEVFDLKTQTFLSPIKVGQLPHSMAMGTDGNTLYVANTGGESVSIVDLIKGSQTGRVAFPAFPINAAVTIANPVTIAVSGRGPQFIMSDGSWWKVDSTGHAIPRTLNTSIFNTRTIPGGTPTQWTMASTPGGEYVLIVNGAGNAYLYDYIADDITITKSPLTAVQGYIGPVAAGPLGRYYSIGGTFLNSSLTAVQGSTTGLSPTNRLVPAVAAVSANQIALFTVPARANGNAAAADAGMVELYDPATGISAGTAPAIEGPASIVAGTNRTSAFGRTMAYDAASSTAYALTATGLSIIRTGAATGPAAARPTINAGGVVNLADLTTPIAPGGLFSIMGKNLGTASTSAPPWPTLAGGLCVTLNNQLIPLSMTSAGQINSQVPVTLAAGRYPLIIRNTDAQTISATTTVTVSKYAPAVMVDSNGDAAITHQDGTHVNQLKPGRRDETIYLYATGMGVTHGAAVITGAAVPASPAATTDAVQVFFGNPLWKQAAMIVRSSVLVPGMVGITQIAVTIPGFHIKGSSLPVTVKIGGVSSSTTSPLAPLVSVN